MEAAIVILGVLITVCACGVVFSRQSLHSALWLVAVLFLAGAYFAVLDAGFLAVVQVLIYAGAIVILMVFVIMLLGADAGAVKSVFRLPAYLGGALGGMLAGVLIVFALSGAKVELAPVKGSGLGGGTAEELGRELFGRYLFAFETIGVLLFAALLGAVILAAEQKRPLTPGRGLRAVQEVRKAEIKENVD